jgi:hypothetical protein
MRIKPGALGAIATAIATSALVMGSLTIVPGCYQATSPSATVHNATAPTALANGTAGQPPDTYHDI